MSLETDLRALLVAAGSVTALVGTRISADRIEQGAARPFIVFARTETPAEPARALNGTVHGGERAVFELQVWADTRLAADAAAAAVTTVLEAANQLVTNRTATSDGDLDLEATVLTVDWWT